MGDSVALQVDVPTIRLDSVNDVIHLVEQTSLLFQFHRRRHSISAKATAMTSSLINLLHYLEDGESATAVR